MENYGCSYPDSGDSSPRSREIEFENPPLSWEEQPPLPGGFRVKFMISYGGKIQPRAHDNQLSYVGGETKILAVDRNVKFSSLISKLSALCDGADVTFKYQLPGEDLDALISVTNDDDLEHMMHEYDRLHRGSSKPARLRLFLLPPSYAGQPASGFGAGCTNTKSDADRFAESLNSGPVHAPGDSTALSPPPPPPENNVDFLFGLDKGVGAGVLPPPVIKVQDSIPDQEIQVRAPINTDEKIFGLDPQIDARIQELNRLQISAQERQVFYRPKSDDNFVGAFQGDSYVQKPPEKLPPPAIMPSIPPSVSNPAAYWPPEKNIPGGSFPVALGVEQKQQPVYMIAAPASVYHHPPTIRPVNGQATQGYYQVQRIPSDVYREPPVYNMVQAPMSAPPPPTVPGTLPPQLPKIAGAYPEGMGMQMRTVTSGVPVTDTGYAQVAYDSATGRQIYYSAAGGPVATTSYQGMMGAAVNAADVRPAVGLTAEEWVGKRHNPKGLKRKDPSHGSLVPDPRGQQSSGLASKPLEGSPT
ncbi:hypothetical protein Ancab_017544 [Ancistrocladus abbreviatus]